MLPDPQSNDRVLVFKEHEGEEGKAPATISFTDFEFKPLGFEELAAVSLHKSITIPLEIYNGRIAHTDIKGVDESRYSTKTELQSHFTSKAIGLVRGGWLPSTLGAHRSRTVILVDRNVVTEIVSRFEGGEKKGREPDFLDLFGDQPVRINPLLYAMEGNARTIPSPELVAKQLNEVIGKLQKALPKADLQIGPDSLKGILGVIEDTRAGMNRRQDFLLRLAPSLQSPVSRRHFDRRWNEVLDAADACSVRRNSLVVLAALSSVAVPGGASPAKALLKFKGSYCEADAYTALADLRSLEMLINLFALFPNEIIQLCTADKNLALFWTGIRAHNFRHNGSCASFDLNPVEGLLPGDAQERWSQLTH